MMNIIDDSNNMINLSETQIKKVLEFHKMIKESEIEKINILFKELLEEENGVENIVQFLEARGDCGNTALHYAVCNDTLPVNIIETLLRPLHNNNRYEEIRRLLELEDGLGDTVLHIIPSEDPDIHVNIVEALLRPLHNNNKREQIEEILTTESGSNGNTIFDIASESENLNLLGLLSDMLPETAKTPKGMQRFFSDRNSDNNNFFLPLSRNENHENFLTRRQNFEPVFRRSSIGSTLLRAKRALLEREQSERENEESYLKPEEKFSEINISTIHHDAYETDSDISDAPEEEVDSNQVKKLEERRKNKDSKDKSSNSR